MELNKNQKVRDEIIFGKSEIKYSGGICSFEDLDYSTLKTLVEQGFADIEDAQNNAPTLGEFLNFMEEHSCFNAHGYVVNISRGDYRVSIEGLCGKTKNKKEISAFKNFNKYADEIECKSGFQRSWWD